jgi:dolichol kinase
LLLGMSIVYMATRHRAPIPQSRSPPLSAFARLSSPVYLSSTHATNVRERSSRMSHGHGPNTPSSSIASFRDELRRISPTGMLDEQAVAEPKGCVWGTEGREYRYVLVQVTMPKTDCCRDCPDDGALFALLLAPLVAAGLLHASLSQLSLAPESPLPPNWNIESPLVLHSTPIRPLPGITLFPTDSIRALSALATSRRNLVQLFTLCAFVLLVHLARSLHLESKQAKAASTSATTGGGIAMERDLSGSHRDQSSISPSATGTHWLKRGEWRRTKSVVGFAFLVTLCCVGVKIVTALIGRGVWSGMSPSYFLRQEVC